MTHVDGWRAIKVKEKRRESEEEEKELRRERVKRKHLSMIRIDKVDKRAQQNRKQKRVKMGMDEAERKNR